MSSTREEAARAYAVITGCTIAEAQQKFAAGGGGGGATRGGGAGRGGGAQRGGGPRTKSPGKKPTNNESLEKIMEHEGKALKKLQNAGLAQLRPMHPPATSHHVSQEPSRPQELVYSFIRFFELLCRIGIAMGFGTTILYTQSMTLPGVVSHLNGQLGSSAIKSEAVQVFTQILTCIGFGLLALFAVVAWFVTKLLKMNNVFRQVAALVALTCMLRDRHNIVFGDANGKPIFMPLGTRQTCPWLASVLGEAETTSARHLLLSSSTRDRLSQTAVKSALGFQPSQSCGVQTHTTPKVKSWKPCLSSSSNICPHPDAPLQHCQSTSDRLTEQLVSTCDREKCMQHDENSPQDVSHNDTWVRDKKCDASSLVLTVVCQRWHTSDHLKKDNVNTTFVPHCEVSAESDDEVECSTINPTGCAYLQCLQTIKQAPSGIFAFLRETTADVERLALPTAESNALPPARSKFHRYIVWGLILNFVLIFAFWACMYGDEDAPVSQNNVLSDKSAYMLLIWSACIWGMLVAKAHWKYTLV